MHERQTICWCRRYLIVNFIDRLAAPANRACGRRYIDACCVGDRLADIKALKQRNFIGIPFAVPYFAAIDQILKTDFSTVQVVISLVAYNLVYALPFALVPVLSAVMGERAKPVLARINAVMDKISGFLMPLMLGLIGLALLADALSYFFRGIPLF